MFASPRLNRLMRLTQTISLDKAQKGIKEALETLLLSERKVVERERGTVVREGIQVHWNEFKHNIV